MLSIQHFQLSKASNISIFGKIFMCTPEKVGLREPKVADPFDLVDWKIYKN